MTRAALYARVSTGAQDHALQLDALRSLSQHRGHDAIEYVDTATGSGARILPERARMIADARDGKLDIVLVWRLDRLGRSTRDLLETIENFGTWGVAFVSMKDALDTSTPAGKLVFTIVASIAEFERSLIIERVRAGQEAARRRGRLPGRPRRFVDLDRARALLASGIGARAAARKMGIPARTFRRALDREGRKPVPEREMKVREIASSPVFSGDGGKK